MLAAETAEDRQARRKGRKARTSDIVMTVLIFARLNKKRSA